MSRLKTTFWWIVQVGCVILLCIASTPRLSHSAVVLSPGPFGLGSLTYDGGQYLIKAPSCYVANAAFRRGASQVPLPGGNGILTVRSAGNRVMITRAYQWGTIKCAYSVSADQVRTDVSVTNATPYTIAEVRILLMGIARPGQPITRMPGAEYNLGGPDVVFMTYGPAKLFIANEEVAKLLYLTVPQIPGGIGIYLDTAQNWVLPSLMPKGPARRQLVSRPIPASGSDQYSLSLRFANPGAPAPTVLSDVFRRWSERFPPTLNWPDRRPIGQLILAGQGPSTPFNPRNPRYWRIADPNVDVNSGPGRQEFKTRLLAEADKSVANLKQVNAQGVIVWDIEGEQFSQLQYIGDPRHLPPEMQDGVDEFFKRFTRAGLRCGLTLAVRKLMNPDAADRNSPLTNQTTRRYLDSPDELFTLLDQIVTYSQRRWGCTIFYVDANGSAAIPTDFMVFRRLSAAHPGDLFIPEQKTLTYYASTAPYCDHTLGRETCPSSEARWIYPKAFSVIKDYQASVRPGFTPMNTVQRVRNGDALLIESWVNSSHPDVRRSMDVMQRALGSQSPPAQ